MHCTADLPKLPLYPLAVGPLHDDLAVRHVVHEVALDLVVVLCLERSASVGQAVSEHSFQSGEECSCNFTA